MVVIKFAIRRFGLGQSGEHWVERVKRDHPESNGAAVNGLVAGHGGNGGDHYLDFLDDFLLDLFDDFYFFDDLYGFFNLDDLLDFDDLLDDFGIRGASNRRD